MRGATRAPAALSARVPRLPALALPLLLAACADAGGLGFRGQPLSTDAFTGAFQRLNDGAYAAGARAGERLGVSPPAETPRAGEWRPLAPVPPTRP